MRPLEKVLDCLEGVRQSNGSWQAICPAHDDHKPSLSISEGDDGRALVKCFAGCETDAVLTRLGLRMADLFVNTNGQRKKFGSTPLKSDSTVQRCTLKDYSQAKGLPVDFLSGLGLVDRKYQRKAAVRIPYLAEDGQESAVRFRIAQGARVAVEWSASPSAAPDKWVVNDYPAHYETTNLRASFE